MTFNATPSNASLIDQLNMTGVTAEVSNQNYLPKKKHKR